MNEIYSIPLLISIATFILTTHITPGPTNIILLSSVLNFGYKRTLPFMIANIISYPIMMSFTALGVGVYLIKHPTIMLILKFVGIIYLCYMAYKIANNKSSYETNETIQSEPFTFLQGLIYPFLNPKAWIVYTSVISIYVTSIDKSFLQIGIIIFFIFISMIITTYFWSFGGITLKKMLKNEKFTRKLNISMAILLVLSVVPILF